MHELKDCLDIRREIEKIDEKLLELSYSIKYPKIQAVSDMPKSTSSNFNSIEHYVEKQDELRSKKYLLETKLLLQWQQIEKDMSSASNEEKALMKLRFYNGYSWKQCTIAMANNDDKWNENKTFRIYKKVVKMLQKG